MLDIPKIKKLFASMNKALKEMDVAGEIGICGGAVMCLVYRARKSTKDIDGIFEPTREMRKAAKKVARAFGIGEDWLNDAVKGYFHVDPPRENVLEYSNLRVWAPRADYLLAMKAISARFDTHDKDDLLFLIRYLNLNAAEKIFNIIEKYYPRSRIPPKTKFLIEELMEAMTIIGRQQKLPPIRRRKARRNPGGRCR